MSIVNPAADQLLPSPPPSVRAVEAGRPYQDVVFGQPIGYRPLLLDLYLPLARESVPVVVCIYGGGFAMGSHKTDPLGAYLTQRLLGQGIGVARPQYRHSREAAFPAPLHDLKAAVRWLRHYAGQLGIDAAHIGAWGASSGGHLATMLAVTGGEAQMEGYVGFLGPSSIVQAAVAWSAPVDIARLPGPPVESPFHTMGIDPHDWLLGGAVSEHPDRARFASTNTHVTASASPLLVVHGETDASIPIDQAGEIVKDYRCAGTVVEFIRIPGTGHFFDDQTRAAQTTAGIAFLRAHL